MTSPDEREIDVIGGFEHAHPHCNGCHNPLTIENAWMTDGCPCNSELGINSMNETRWRLLMQLQQRDSAEVERLKGYLDRLDGVCIDLAAERRLREAAVAALRKRYQSYLSRMYAMSEPFPNESATKMLCDDLNLDRATFDELGIGDTP